MSAAATAQSPAAALAAVYARAGLQCQIEVGRCLVIYAASAATCATVARSVLEAARKKDPHARIDSMPQFDRDEPAESAWWVTVSFDQEAF